MILGALIVFIIAVMIVSATEDSSGGEQGFDPIKAIGAIAFVVFIIGLISGC